MSIFSGGGSLPVFEAGYRLPDGTDLNRLTSAIKNALTWPGKIIYCDPSATQDGPGTLSGPANSLVSALGLAVAGRNDVIVLVGDGSTTATARLTATLDWNKNATHLIGITAPSWIAQRARISHLTSATTNINPLMTVSASGCMFQNFSFFQGIGQASTDEQLINVTGDRNYFYNVHFGGMGATAGAARAGSYVIGLNGGDENLFEHCVIGLDTIARSAANASVKLVGASQRNTFRECLFNMYPTAATPLYLDANLSGGLNGSSMWFIGCTFAVLFNAASSTQPAVTTTPHASLNGTIYFDRCTTGAAKWAAATALVKVAGYPGSDGFDGGVFASAADS